MKRGPGRPKVDPSQSVTRSWKLPRELYERLQAIAEREGRDTSGQVVKVLHDFVEQYEAKASKSPGNPLPIYQTATA